MEFNADITVANKYGHTPCFVADFNGNKECVNYLIMVETCVKLSIKVVKLSRDLRETKNSNEALKAQMDEVILIKQILLTKKFSYSIKFEF